MTRFPMRAHRTFAPEAISVSQARAFTRRTLEGWGAGELVDSASLIVSELVTNAVVHTGTPARLALWLQGHDLRVEVEDQHPEQIPALHRRPGAGDRRARARSPDHHVALLHLGRRVHPDGQAGVGVVLRRRRPARARGTARPAPVGPGSRTWRSSRSRPTAPSRRGTPTRPRCSGGPPRRRSAGRTSTWSTPPAAAPRPRTSARRPVRGRGRAPTPCSAATAPGTGVRHAPTRGRPRRHHRPAGRGGAASPSRAPGARPRPTRLQAPPPVCVTRRWSGSAPRSTSRWRRSGPGPGRSRCDVRAPGARLRRRLRGRRGERPARGAAGDPAQAQAPPAPPTLATPGSPWWCPTSRTSTYPCWPAPSCARWWSCR